MNKEQKARKVAEASYLALRDALDQPGPAGLVLPQSVIDFALGRAVADEGAVRRHLGEDLACRRLYREALAQRRLAQSPIQACAQDKGEVTRRSGEGFELHFRRSQASPGQVYVTLQLLPGIEIEDGVGLEIHAIADHDILRVSFPPLHDQQSQRLFEDQDAVLQLLRDDRAELEVLRA
ncbi:hypothetical protein [Wenzhouxiangella marina]|uniref:Uncharacterized protein n=1 Tax=Wenzhouxiangella marina TaxID=1579979 RepID=A0A0K0XV01_9GAMM|nr:hypothetical protein [Wenzhouxiangella marina]AKS41452.1 hypothetical protein WM2015_1076 [Wenzhouxiangella marina]MBB6086793.1 hypothetical protein [Wenzhouxiangella marina]